MSDDNKPAPVKPREFALKGYPGIKNGALYCSPETLRDFTKYIADLNAECERLKSDLNPYELKLIDEVKALEAEVGRLREATKLTPEQWRVQAVNFEQWEKATNLASELEAQLAAMTVQAARWRYVCDTDKVTLQEELAAMTSELEKYRLCNRVLAGNSHSLQRALEREALLLEALRTISCGEVKAHEVAQEALEAHAKLLKGDR